MTTFEVKTAMKIFPKTGTSQIKTKSAKLPGFDPVGGAGDLTGDGSQSVHLHDHSEAETKL